MRAFGLLLCLAWLMLAGACGASEWCVLDSGAVADGVTDNTPAFQKALDEAGKAGGGTVNVPAGQYRIDGNLVVPSNVTLQGTYRVPPFAQRGNVEAAKGSVLLAYAGRGSEEGEPFIRLKGSACAIAGLIVMYPEWSKSDVPPVPYPPCVGSEDSKNVGILDCLLLNPYEAISLVRAHRFIVRNVQGYPIKRGIYVDQCYDVARIENVHFWPFRTPYDPENPYCKWINTQGVAFEFARVDWPYVLNTFCFGYGVGYKFSESEHGSSNGNFVGIGADSCRRPVLVEQCSTAGLLILNGEFVGRWASEDAVGVEIGEQCKGKVSMNNCIFFGPIDRDVWLRGPSAQFTAIGCNFGGWDNTGLGSPAIQLDAGKAIVQGSTFGDGALHVRIGENVSSAILIGNQANDGLVIDNRAGERTQMVANELSPVVWTDAAKAHYRITIGSKGDVRYVRKWQQREDPIRWSRPPSMLVLPVLPGKQYTISIDLDVPQAARADNAGLYLGEDRIAQLPDADSGTIRAVLPPSDSDTVTLRLKCKAWIPKQIIEGSEDTRWLGLQVRSVTMQAKGAKWKLFDANTGEWAK